jgi:predicted ATP-grasp superfamily ATP-dependent carboligase
MGETMEHPSAIVLGLTEAGLGVARSLHRRGIRVFGLHSSGERPPAASSRHLEFVPGWEIQDPDAALEFLRKLLPRAGRGSVLFPTGDQNLLFVHRQRHRLAEDFRFYVWDSPLLEEMSSKRGLVGLSERLGLPVPRTIVPESIDDLKAGLKSLRFPCIVKPEYTHLWGTRTASELGLMGVKALPVGTPDELLAVYEKLHAAACPVIVQEMILGPDENHLDYKALVGEDGTILAEFTARKLRVWPAHYGMSCLAESILAPDVVEIGRLVLERLRYRGMAAVQFKRDSRDGRLYFLELNPRVAVWVSLAMACGIDFPYYIYQLSLGRPFQRPDGFKVGRRWWNPSRDVVSMRTYLRDGTWTYRRWFTSIARPHTNPYFAADDMMPGFAVLGDLFRKSLGFLSRRGSSLKIV